MVECGSLFCCMVWGILAKTTNGSWGSINLYKHQRIHLKCPESSTLSKNTGISLVLSFCWCLAGFWWWDQSLCIFKCFFLFLEHPFQLTHEMWFWRCWTGSLLAYIWLEPTWWVEEIQCLRSTLAHWYCCFETHKCEEIIYFAVYMSTWYEYQSLDHSINNRSKTNQLSDHHLHQPFSSNR